MNFYRRISGIAAAVPPGGRVSHRNPGLNPMHPMRFARKGQLQTACYIGRFVTILRRWRHVSRTIRRKKDSRTNMACCLARALSDTVQCNSDQRIVWGSSTVHSKAPSRFCASWGQVATALFFSCGAVNISGLRRRYQRIRAFFDITRPIAPRVRSGVAAAVNTLWPHQTENCLNSD